MLIKRLLLAVISFGLGYAITFFIVTVVLQTSVAEFWIGPELPVHIPYFILTGIFIGLAIGVWLDKFMGTEILPK